jgi:hypothetical protein
MRLGALELLNWVLLQIGPHVSHKHDICRLVVFIPRQVQVPQQLPHQALHLNQISQRIRFCCTNSAGIAHLCQELRNHIIVTFYFMWQHRPAKKVFEDIDHPMKELERKQRLDLG